MIEPPHYAFWQRIAARQELARAHRKLLHVEPHNFDARFDRPQNADRFAHHIRSDTVARQQSDQEVPGGIAHAPVTSFSLSKNWRLRRVSMPQFTGGHWYPSGSKWPQLA